MGWDAASSSGNEFETDIRFVVIALESGVVCLLWSSASSSSSAAAVDAPYFTKSFHRSFKGSKTSTLVSAAAAAAAAAGVWVGVTAAATVDDARARPSRPRT